jgi:hypothetical protein
MTHAERLHTELVEDALRAIERVYEDESVSERTALASLDRLAGSVAASLGCLREMSAEAEPDGPTSGQPPWATPAVTGKPADQQAAGVSLKEDGKPDADGRNGPALRSSRRPYHGR